MSAFARTAGTARPGSAGAARTALLAGALVFATALATVVADGHPAAAVAPAVLACVALVALSAPVRWSALGLLVLVLAMDDFDTADGLWRTPWAALNQLLIYNVDRSIPALRGFKIAGLEMAAVGLLALAAWRRAARSRIDAAGAAQTASVLAGAALVSLLAVAYALARGLGTGGAFMAAVFQSRPMLQVLLFLALFSAALRGSRDATLVGGAVVFAAAAKAVLALYVAWMFRWGERLPYATSHGDSLLFATAAIVLIAGFVERPDRRRLATAALLLPVLLAGMYANNRRLAWLQLLAGLGVMYLLVPWTRWWKRAATRWALVASPVVLLYAATGWHSDSRVFAPVRAVSSTVEGRGDRSTFFRDVENYNLIMGMRDAPLAGRGFGHPFTEVIPTDDISQFYREYFIAPHNQVLALLYFAGAIAFTGVWLLLATGMFLAARSYRLAATARQRTIALCCHATIVMALLDAYGDLGPFHTQYKLLVALALALAGKLAVETGAWPVRDRILPWRSGRQGP